MPTRPASRHIRRLPLCAGMSRTASRRWCGFTPPASPAICSDSLRCDCGSQLHHALQQIDEAGKGALIYLEQEGRGIGLINKLKAYELQDHGADTVQANEMLGFKPDLRDYGIGAQIMADIGLKKVRFMTNNPKKVAGLEGYGLEIVEWVPIPTAPNPYNYRYLKTKQEKMGHRIDVDLESAEGVPPPLHEQEV